MVQNFTKPYFLIKFVAKTPLMEELVGALSPIAGCMSDLHNAIKGYTK